MALLWLDGFESYGTTLNSAPAPTGVLARKYDSLNYENYFKVQTGRNGSGRSVQLTGTYCSMRTASLTTNTTLIVGFAFKTPTNSASNGASICNLYNGTTLSIGMYMVGTGVMIIRNRYNNNIGVVNHTFQRNKWYFIELKMYTDSSAGTIEVRVGGVTVLNLTGLSNDYTGAGYVDNVSWYEYVGIQVYVDDVYICDGSGTDFNDFLGNGKVETLRPDGADTSGWGTSSPSSTHYENVDDEECDDNTSYEQSNVSSAQELYTVSDVSSITTVKGLMVSTMARTNSGTSETMQTTVSSNGTTTTANHTFSATTYATQIFVVEQDPDASAAWTTTTINAAKFGYMYV